MINDDSEKVNIYWVCSPQRVRISPSRLHIIYRLHVYEKSAKRLDVWHGSFLTMAWRGVLIKSSLNNSAILSNVYISLTPDHHDKIDKNRSHFLI
jgi:hypothetical protein